MKNVLVTVAVLSALCALPACAPDVGPGDGLAGRWGYVGGMTVKRPDAEVKNTEDKVIYLNERYLLTAYRIPVRNAAYAVKLHFAETYPGITGVGKRVFSVSIEGKPVLTDFDVYKEAGKQRLAAVVKEFQTEVEDGELTIDFHKKVQNTMINGIEVALKSRGVLLINCGAAEDYKDKAGRIWQKDQPFQAP